MKKLLEIIQLKTRKTCQINLNAVILSHFRNSTRRTKIKWTLKRVAMYRKAVIRPQRSSKHKFRVVANLSLQIPTQILCPNASQYKLAQKRLTITLSWSKTRKWCETNWQVKMPAKKKQLTKISRQKKSGKKSRKKRGSHLCQLQAKMMNHWKSDITESSMKIDYYICTSTTTYFI